MANVTPGCRPAQLKLSRSESRVVNINDVVSIFFLKRLTRSKLIRLLRRRVS